MAEEKSRHSVWLAHDAWAMVESHYRADNCSTKNEFIDKAIRFYTGYLDADGDDSFLPTALSRELDGKLSMLAKRVGRMREDAARLGFDSAKSWRNVLRSKQLELAAAMKISPKNFRWCAAFHDEATHPHVHMMIWSADPKRAFAYGGAWASRLYAGQRIPDDPHEFLRALLDRPVLAAL